MCTLPSGGGSLQDWSAQSLEYLACGAAKASAGSTETTNVLSLITICEAVEKRVEELWHKIG